MGYVKVTHYPGICSFWLRYVFSHLLNPSLRNNMISGLKIARQCPTLSHLLFADDMLLFLKADVDECQHVLDILKIYCEALGQLVNL